MALTDAFNPEALTQTLVTPYLNRMVEEGIPDAEIQPNAQLLAHFSNIACSLLVQDATLTLPDQAPIELDNTTAERSVELFVEGIYHALARLRHEEGITADTRMQVLQSLALEVFNHAKQVAASTMGQELTPDIQISVQQQLDWIHQSSDSLLTYFLTELAKQAPAEETEVPDNTPQQQPQPEARHEELEEKPEEEAIAAAAETGPHPNDKYAAVALLLGSLPQAQHQRLLNRFNETEQALIAHYQSPSVIAAELDLNCVHEKLKQLRSVLRQDKPQDSETETQAAATAPTVTAAQIRLPETQAETDLAQARQQWQTLVTQIPQEHYLALAQAERASIRSFLQHSYSPAPVSPIAFSARLGGPTADQSMAIGMLPHWLAYCKEHGVA